MNETSTDAKAFGIADQPANLNDHIAELGLAEPFVLKPADRLAPVVITDWIRRALEVNLASDAPEIPAEKIAGAAEHLAAIVRAQRDAGSRWPD